jgi:hypothetical protein
VISLTDRDINIVNFIHEVGLATTKNINDLFFSDVSRTVLSRRLNHLVDYNFLKRIRVKELNNSYMYYIDSKPKHLVHELIGTSFYVALSNLGFNIIRFMRNKKLGNCIIDIIVIAEINGSEEVFFVEVQRHFNHITKCTDKYKELYYSNTWKEVFEDFPKVVVVSDMKYLPRYSEFEVLKIKTDCSDISKLLS